MVVLGSSSANTVEALGRLVQTSPDRVREMIHRFNGGMASLNSRAGSRPRRITTEEEAFIVETAKGRLHKAGRPLTHWSIRKLREYLGNNDVRKVVIGRERLRQILERHEVTFQRTKTWTDSNDPLKDAKLDGTDQSGAGDRRVPLSLFRAIERHGVPQSTYLLSVRSITTIVATRLCAAGRVDRHPSLVPDLREPTDRASGFWGHADHAQAPPSAKQPPTASPASTRRSTRPTPTPRPSSNASTPNWAPPPAPGEGRSNQVRRDRVEDIPVQGVQAR